jgi:TonB-linked SusC/RagA family outer membrane protein
MYKPRPIQEVFYLIMRITFTQILMMILLTSLVSAGHLKSHGQGILDRTVSLHVENEDVKKILLEVEKQTSVSFTYQDKIIKPFDKVSISVSEVPLREVLNMIFESHVSVLAVDEEEEIVLGPGSEEVNATIVIPELAVSGKVTDGSGDALPGVNVIEKGTSNGTTTNVDGQFNLTVQGENSTLVFSFIGYKSQEVSVGNQTNFNIAMVNDVTNLSEIIVVGYGEQKKETLTGSVSNIAGKEITKSPSANVTSSLAGRLPGLYVNQRSGEPGRDDPSIFIRGNATFAGDPNTTAQRNAPLIIVDGVPRSLMSRLNPEDIESISVLKDASAAIYGARAANGVILITTKKGTKGKPVFDFSYNYAFQRPTKILEVLDAPTFARVFNEAAWYRAGRPANFTPFYSDDAIQKFGNGSDPVLYPNTDWVDEILRPYSAQQRINMSATGGSETVRYFLSFGTMRQDGNFRYNPSGYEQYNVRVKVDVNLTKNLTLGANISAILNDRTYSSTTVDPNNGNSTSVTEFTNILHANPTLVARYPNGLIGPGRLGENPMLLPQRGTATTEDAPLYSSFSASYKIPFIEGLKLDVTYNYDLSNQFEKIFRKPYYFHEYNTVTQQYEKRQGTGTATSELWDTYRKWTTVLYNFRVSYDKSFDKHHMGVMVGVEQQKNRHSWAQAYRRDFVSTLIDQIDVGSDAADDKNSRGSASIGGYNNYFGRVNYDFEGKYLAEFLFRYDGSQIFPKENRYGFFPGLSAGWRLSEENFMQHITAIDHLKLRASYGQIANDRVDAYQYQQAFSIGDHYVFGSSTVPGIYPRVLPNPNITWEVSKKTDIGIDGSFWNQKLGFDLTLFQERRSSILTRRNVSISNVYGFPGLPDENIGKARNTGFELVLTHKNSVREITYQISANTAFARNEIVFMDEVPQDQSYKNQTGHPIGAGLFYKADGIFNTQEELDAYPHLNNAQVGDTKLLDLNSDGRIDGADQFRFDYTSRPEHVFGMNIDVQYKKFDLSIFFQGQTNAYNFDDRFGVLGTSAFDNASVYRATDRWTVENPNGTMPRADESTPNNNTMWLFDATFVRLKTIELGYSLPGSLISRFGLSNVRFYVSGFNVLTWAKEIKWTDPEINGNALYYPQQRVLNLGLNVKF